MQRCSPGATTPRFLASSAHSFLALVVVLLALSPSARASVDTYGLGDGHDGPLVATGDFQRTGASSKLVAPATVGANTISIANTLWFPVGRLIMVVRSSGVVPARVVGDSSPIDLTTNDIGRYELVRITARTVLPAGQGVALTLDQPLDLYWPLDGSQVVEVPEYTTVSVAAGTYLGAGYYGSTGTSGDASGGITAFLATSTVTNNGTIGGFGQGFRGAYGTASFRTSGCSENDAGLPFKGEGISSARATLRGPGMVGNAGGAGCSTGGGGGGGGVGRGADGLNPTASNLARGGVGSSATDALGAPLMRLTFGGGGGAGHTDMAGGVASGMSGPGGGVVFLRARELTGAGTINVSGRVGDVIHTQGGGGGGGGGTAVVLTTGPLSCTAILANGGTGGVSGSRSGGHGGGGRIVLQGSAISCPTSVTSGGGTGNVGAAGVVHVLPPPPLDMTLNVPHTIFANESALFSGAATTGSLVTFTVDGVTAGTVTATAGQWSFARVLSNGAHTISVQASLSGRISPTVTRTVSASYRVPETTIVSGPPLNSRSVTSTFDFTSNVASATYRCSLDGAAFSACTDPATITAAAQGAHSLSVVAVNSGVVDPTPAIRTWTLDTVVPETTLTSTPPAATIDQTVTFAWTSNESGTADCYVDNVGRPCTSPFTVEVAGGVHTFSVAAKDAAGNLDPTPATFQWEALTNAPLTAITGKPGLLVNLSTVSFTFTSSIANSTFECKLDGSAFSACSSPTSYATPTSAVRTFAVRARSPAGLVDATPVTYTWTTDRTAPNTTATSSLPPRIGANQVTVSFASNEPSTFDCRINSGAWNACASPAALTLPVNVSVAIEVRARDTAGNVDASPLRFSTFVDTIAPNTTITSAPSGTVSGTSFNFTFSATESSSFSCSLNGDAFEACTSPATRALSEGAQTFRVRATDAIGLVDATPAEVSFVVDRTPPEAPTITAPLVGQRLASGSFTTTGTTEAGSTFDLKLDGVAVATGGGEVGAFDSPHSTDHIP